MKENAFRLCLTVFAILLVFEVSREVRVYLVVSILFTFPIREWFEEFPRTSEARQKVSWSPLLQVEYFQTSSAGSEDTCCEKYRARAVPFRTLLVRISFSQLSSSRLSKQRYGKAPATGPGARENFSVLLLVRSKRGSPPYRREETCGDNNEKGSATGWRTLGSATARIQLLQVVFDESVLD